MTENMDAALAEFRAILEDAAKGPGEEVVISHATIVRIMTLAVGRPATISTMVAFWPGPQDAGWQMTKLTLIDLQLLIELTTLNAESLLRAGEFEAAIGCRQLIDKLSVMVEEIRREDPVSASSLLKSMHTGFIRYDAAKAYFDALQRLIEAEGYCIMVDPHGLPVNLERRDGS